MLTGSETGSSRFILTIVRVVKMLIKKAMLEVGKALLGKEGFPFGENIASRTRARVAHIPGKIKDNHV